MNGRVAVKEGFKVNDGIIESNPINGEILLSAFDFSPSGIVVIDSSSRIIQVNHAFARLLRYSAPEEIIGLDIRDMIPPEQRLTLRPDQEPEPASSERGDEISEFAALAGSSENMDRELITRDETRIPVKFFLWKVREDPVSGVWYGAFVWDRTVAVQERRINEAMLNLKKAILDNVPDFVWMVDQRGRFISVNRAFAEFHLMSPSAFFGRQPSEFKDFPDYEILLAHNDLVLNSGKRHTYEMKFIHNDCEFWFETSKTPILDMDGGVMGIICLARDISERKKRELDRAMGERFMGALEMAGAVCHEINQPLQAGMGYAELLVMELNSGDQKIDLADRIIKCLDKIGELTRKLTTVTKYETRDYVFRGKRIIDIHKSAKTENGDTA
ncbi:MAG: hypothetical protein CVV64_11175 [Candidatus Wallbacteria bacterium HGW-Wallbacteria-1]|jgi:PAS domain S-box-containing protein|uniref:PAS domain-containing protein n=1 Tax=Candidatus Wallbacteria bacterium HGW-Wallbacteria-1 TaxID=2013854 RepID=A0A2N1PNZ7_9BACT|nr:MAG: hypothetical protein CVV64_11175 [Candidatus Wallbacteria bacterium HGW-Wallbacteria-1]